MKLTPEADAIVHRPKPAPGTVMKFGDMPYGTFFKETREINPRKFIKLQDYYPCVNEDGSLNKILYRSGMSEDALRSEINSIDIDGIPARCPDWLEFEVIAKPE